jgi:hypothetical protein
VLTDFPTLAVFPSPDGRWLALTTIDDRPDVGRWQFAGRLFLLPVDGPRAAIR